MLFRLGKGFEHHLEGGLDAGLANGLAADIAEAHFLDVGAVLGGDGEVDQADRLALGAVARRLRR